MSLFKKVLFFSSSGIKNVKSKRCTYVAVAPGIQPRGVEGSRDVVFQELERSAQAPDLLFAHAALHRVRRTPPLQMFEAPAHADSDVRVLPASPVARVVQRVHEVAANVRQDVGGQAPCERVGGIHDDAHFFPEPAGAGGAAALEKNADNIDIRCPSTQLQLEKKNALIAQW